MIIYTVTMTTSHRTFTQETEAHNVAEAIRIVQAWMFPHEKLKIWECKWSEDDVPHSQSRIIDVTGVASNG